MFQAVSEACGILKGNSSPWTFPEVKVILHTTTKMLFAFFIRSLKVLWRFPEAI